MRVVERGQELLEYADNPGNREKNGLLQEVGKRLPVDEFHGDADAEFGLPEREDPDDVGILKFRERLRFRLEAFEKIRVARNKNIHHLERNVPVQRRVGRPVHDPHPSAPEDFEDLVRIYHLADHWVHGAVTSSRFSRWISVCPCCGTGGLRAPRSRRRVRPVP